MVQKILLKSLEKELAQMGERIRMARLRRDLSMVLVCERAGVSRPTLTLVEKGSPRVSMAAYASVLKAIGISQDLGLIAKDDTLGRKLQDAKLSKTTRVRASKRTS
ncbi:MAG: transcriptional regulator [Gammaproteobacteria bacterium]|nr:MAG: transcriptional regulator [Gammaproteobacteria bacterium]